MPAHRDLAPDPRDGWLPAVVPADARRVTVHDRRLEEVLRRGGAQVVSHGADVEIGPAGRITGAAECAAVPLHARQPEAGVRALRAASRLRGAVGLAWHTRAARRRLHRLGYPLVRTLVWERGEPVRVLGAPDAAAGPLAHRLPLNAVVAGRRQDTAPTVLEAVVAAAGSRATRERAVAPRIGSSGVLVLATAAGHLRIALGLARAGLRAQQAALATLRAAMPVEEVRSRVPWVLERGDVGLASWSLEQSLEGTVPGPGLSEEVTGDVLGFLAQLHLSARGVGEPVPCATAAELVAGRCSAPLGDAVRTCGRVLDEGLAAVPRGFAHGDLWSGNLLVSEGRLSGVVDWAAAGAGRLPLLDLFHLHVSARREGSGASLGAALRSYAAGRRPAEDRAVGEYCERINLRPTEDVLVRLLAAYWPEAVARELTDPDRPGDPSARPAWLRENVAAVAADLMGPSNSLLYSRTQRPECAIEAVRFALPAPAEAGQ